MGTQFLAGLMGGLSSGIAQNRQRQVEEEYRKALIDQSKLQTKKLENDLLLKEYQMKLAAADMANQPPPPFPQLANTQPVSVQQPQQGIFGRIFNPQPPPPAPITPVTTQQSIPEIVSQGQMQAQMPQISPEMRRARGRDIMEHMIYGTAPWREKEQTQQEFKKGEVGTKVTVMTPQGPATIVLNKVGGTMQAYMQPPEYTNIPMTGPKGEPFLYPQPKNFPVGSSPAGFGGQQYGPGGGAGAGMFQTGPAPTDLPKDIPAETRTKIADINNVINSLSVLQNTVKPEYLGIGGKLGEKWDEYSGIVGGGDPNRAAFHRTFNQMKRTEIKQSAGSAVSKQELGFVEAALPKLTMSPEVFTNAAGAIKMLLSMSAYEHAAQAGGPSSQVYANTANNIYKIYMADVKPRIEKALQGDANAFQNYQPSPMPNIPQPGLSQRPQLPTQNITKQKIEIDYQRALQQRPDLAPQLKAKRDQLLQQVR